MSDDNAPHYEETDEEGVYITDETPLICDVPDPGDGIWYDDMTPEQKIKYGIIPTQKPD